MDFPLKNFDASMYPKTEKKKPCHCILPNVLEVRYKVPGSEKYASLVAGVLAGMF